MIEVNRGRYNKGSLRGGGKDGRYFKNILPLF